MPITVQQETPVVKPQVPDPQGNQPEFVDVYDENPGGRPFHTSMPRDLPPEEKLRLIEAKRTAMKAGETVPVAPVTPAGIGQAVASTAAEEALPAVGGALGAMVPGGILARGVASGAGSVVGDVATQRALTGEMPSLNRELLIFGAGTLGQIVPEAVLSNIAYFDANRQFLNAAFHEGFDARQAGGVSKRLGRPVGATQGIDEAQDLATNAEAYASRAQSNLDFTESHLRTTKRQKAATVRRYKELKEPILGDVAHRAGPSGSDVLTPDDYSTIGLAAKAQLPGALGDLRATKNRLYDSALAAVPADRTVPPASTGIVKLASSAREALAESGLDAAQSSRATRILDQIIDRTHGTSAQTLQQPDPYSYPGATKTVNVPGRDPDPLTAQELDTWIRDIGEINPGFAKSGQANKFSTGTLEALEREMHNQLKLLARGTKAEGLYDSANNFFVTEYKPAQAATYDLISEGVTPTSLPHILRNAPPEVIETVLGTNAKQGLIKDPKLLTAVRGAMWDDLVRQATDPALGVVNEKQLLKFWKDLPTATRHAVGGSDTAHINQFLHSLADKAKGAQALRAEAERLGVTVQHLQETKQLYSGQVKAAVKEQTEAVAHVKKLEDILFSVENPNIKLRDEVKASGLLAGLYMIGHGNVVEGFKTIMLGSAAAHFVGRITSKPGLSRLANRMLNAKPGTRAAGRAVDQFMFHFLADAVSDASQGSQGTGVEAVAGAGQ